MSTSVQQLGRYHLYESIGKGGMGEVYRAILNGPAGFRKEVAVKLLHESVSSEKARQELVAEARLGGMFRHNNVVEVQDLGAIDDRLFVVMEMVEGPTLKNLIRQKRLTPQATLEIAVQVCAGLEYAHKLKVNGRWVQLVHCDLKPSNILVSNTGVVKIADFGIAHAVGYTDDIDGIRGTPAYMSPEQAKDQPLTAQSDIFSFGLCLFEAFTGRKLLRAKTLPEMAQKIQQAERILLQPENVAALRAIHPQLLDVLRPCLYNEPKRRYTSIAILQRRLSGLAPLSGHGIMGVLHGTVGDEEEITASDNFILSDRSMTRGNLPPSTDLFIGREKDIDDIVETCHSGVQILTLQGPGGVGKTQLAIQAAYRMNERFTGGLWFVDLSEATNIMDIVTKTADQLSIPLVEKEEEAAIEAISNALKLLEHNLLIFDNFEQVIHLAPKTLGRWVSSPGRQDSTNVFIVTSQIRLGLPREKVMVITPLSEADGLLFLQQKMIGLGHNTEWTATQQNLLKEIVQSLDGLPLALEMIASRLRLFTIEQIYQRLQERFKLLQDNNRGATRHTSIYNAIDWSWSLLSDTEQSVLMQLASFRDGFSVDDAEHVVDLSDDPMSLMVMDHIESLLDRSMLVIVREGPRFSMLRSVFAFVEQKLDGHDNSEGIFYQHAQYYTQWDRRLPEFYRHNGDKLLLQLIDDSGNLRIAFERALSHQWIDLLPPLARVLAFLARLHGPEDEGRRVLEQVLALSEITGSDRVQLQIAYYKLSLGQQDWRKLLSELQQMYSEFSEELNNRDVANLLILEGRLYARVAQWDLAVEKINSALQISESNGFRHVYAKALLLRTRWLPSTPTAYSDLKKVIQLMKQDGNLLQLGQAWFSLGHFVRRRRERGDYKTALDCMCTAQKIAKATNNRSLDASVSMSIANMQILFGNIKEAERSFQRSYELNRRLGRLEDSCLLLGNMASWCIHIGKVDRGWRMLNRAKRILDSVKGQGGFQVAKMVFTANTAIILNIRGQHDLALPYAKLAWKLSSLDSQSHLTPFVAIILLETHVGLGEMEEAEALWPIFQHLSVDHLDAHGQIRTLLQRGMASVLLGKRGDASVVARRVYDLIVQEDLSDLEVHYEYSKLIRLLYQQDHTSMDD